MIQHITEDGARQYLTNLLYRLGLTGDETERVIEKLPEHGFTLVEYVQGLEREKLKYYQEQNPTIH